MKQLIKRLKSFLAERGLLPVYGEETIFLILVSLIAIVLVDPEMRETAKVFFMQSPKMILYFGVFYTIATTLCMDFRTERQKKFMLCFVLIANIGSLLAVGLSVFGGRFAVLPGIFFLLNALTLISIALLFFAGELDVNTIPTRSAGLARVFSGSLAVVVLVCVGGYGLHLSWPALFSLSVSYAMLFNQKVMGQLPQFSSKRLRRIDAIENLAKRALAAFVVEFEKPEETEPFCLIVTTERIRKVLIPFQSAKHVLDFYQRELAQEKRTEPFVVVVIAGEIDHTKFFGGERKQSAIVGRVYPNTRKRGYRFARYLDEKTMHVVHLEPVYLDRVDNLFVR